MDDNKAPQIASIDKRIFGCTSTIENCVRYDFLNDYHDRLFLVFFIIWECILLFGYVTIN